jgi:hypothetical protein
MIEIKPLEMYLLRPVYTMYHLLTIDRRGGAKTSPQVEEEKDQAPSRGFLTQRTN